MKIKYSILVIMTLLINFFLVYGREKMSKDNLVLVPVKNDPTVSIRVWFKVGAQNDPVGKEGLAYLTAKMLSDASTMNNSYEQILDKLFPLAASYNANPSMEMTIFNGRVHVDNIKVYYPLFIDAILNPAFKEVDFNRIKDETLNYLNTTLKYSNDEELGKAVLYNEIFNGTPYGHLVTGNISGIQNITINDVKNFYKKYYTNKNYVLGIGGGYSESLVKELSKDLDKLPDLNVEAVDKPQSQKIDGLNVVIVEKDANATAISIGYPINILRGSKEWYALAIANSWLGEHRNSSSHLYQVIREARGLNYGDYSYIENFPNGGSLQIPPVNVARRQQIFEIWIRPVPNETRHFSLRAAIRELHKLVDNGMSESEFTLTKNFLYKYVLHFAPSTSLRLGYAIDDEFYGIDGIHLEKFRNMIKEISIEDVNNAIKKHLQYKNMKIAIITNNANQLKDDLINDVESPIIYTTPKSEEVYSEDKEIIKYQLNIKPDNVDIVKVEELFK